MRSSKCPTLVKTAWLPSQIYRANILCCFFFFFALFDLITTELQIWWMCWIPSLGPKGFLLTISASASTIAPHRWWVCWRFQAESCQAPGPEFCWSLQMWLCPWVHVERNRMKMRNTIHGSAFSGEISVVVMIDRRYLQTQRVSSLVAKALMNS